MLLWQPSGRNKYLFLLELVVISTVIHAILGLLLFVVYKGSATSFRVELGKSHSPTLFMPLKRHASCGHVTTTHKVRGRPSRVGTHNAGKHKVNQPAHAQCANNSDMPDVRTAESVPEGAQQEKKIAMRLGSDMTMGWDESKASARPKRIVGKKEASKKKKKVQITKKQVHAKQVQSEQPVPITKTAVAPRATNVQKDEVSVQTLSEQKIEKKSAMQGKTAVPEIQAEGPVMTTVPMVDEVTECLSEVAGDMQQTENQRGAPDEGTEQDSAGGDYGLDEITIGQYDGEYLTAEQAHVYACVEQEIVSRWRPPRGLSKALACQIKCSIGESGTVVACRLEKSSGVLIYDMAARSAARAMTLGRWAYGKEFTIIFKQ